MNFETCICNYNKLMQLVNISKSFLTLNVKNFETNNTNNQSKLSVNNQKLRKVPYVMNGPPQ